MADMLNPWMNFSSEQNFKIEEHYKAYLSGEIPIGTKLTIVVD